MEKQKRCREIAQRFRDNLSSGLWGPSTSLNKQDKEYGLAKCPDVQEMLSYLYEWDNAEKDSGENSREGYPFMRLIQNDSGTEEYKYWRKKRSELRPNHLFPFEKYSESPLRSVDDRNLIKELK